MKQIMGIKKITTTLPLSFTDIADENYNWDSVETMAAYYTEEIKKTTETLNQLTVLDNAKQIISLCSKIKMMKNKVRRGW